MTAIWESLYSTIFWCFNNLVVVYLTLWLTNYRENKKEKKRFNNRINCVYRELQMNFKHRGNAQKPFLIECLRNLLHEDPVIPNHPVLFDKAHECLCMAINLNSSYPGLTPIEGQNLMEELHGYIKDTYADILITQKPEETLSIRFKSLFFRKSNKVPVKKDPGL